MKKIFLAGTAIVSAVVLTTAAHAADVSTPAPYDWSGFYFGVNAGAAFNNSELNNDLRYTGDSLIADEINDALGSLGNNIDGDQTVFTGGALIGYNWQAESLVLGVEADINYAGFGDENSTDFSAELNDFFNQDDIVGTSDASFDANWFGTLRGRLGFAADNLLIYGTGGLAFGHMEAEVDLYAEDSDGEFASYNESASATNWGWTIGAGLEYGINNWSVGLEYLYVDLGSAEWDGDLAYDVDNIGDDLANISGSGEIDYQFSVVRATAKIRF